jgi:hypothetical protein
MSRSVNRKFRAVGHAELLEETSEVGVDRQLDCYFFIAVGQRFQYSGGAWRAR